MENFNKNDGGREDAGYKGETGDCVTRAISIVTEKPYQEVYDRINELGKLERLSKNKRNRSNAREGVYKETIKKLMEEYGFKWVPTMFIGSGCKVHLKSKELPSGRILANVSKHSVAVIDGIINDTYDCSRDGTRCVYGYFIKS
jgi:hypothetical protein